MKKTVFIKNAAILTVSSLILRFAGIIFKVWLAAKIGAEGIGLYQLAFSVYMFAATFATSGICTAVTRLVSEELVTGTKNGVKRIVRRCCQLSLVFAAVSIIVLFVGADFISQNLLHEPRASLSLKILGFSLPFMGICSCLKGYFIARRKASAYSSSQLVEQAIRIAVIVPLVTRFNHLGLGFTCAAVILGDTIAETASCFFVYVRYRLDFKKISVSGHAANKTYRLLPAVTHIALPITSGRYLNSLLRMIENVLVPICLSASVTGGNGISLFGMIKGMALPVLFFPSTLLSALSTLLLPEISEAAIRGRNGVVKSIVLRIIKITSLVGIIFAGIFWVVGHKLGAIIYHSQDVGFLLSALSPIVPFMYLDAISDGILKGLDQQKFTFFTSISDSAIRIVLILLLLKTHGIHAFIGIMYLSNFLTCFLNTKRLLKISGVRLPIMQFIFMPICSAFTICLFAKFILNYLNLSDLWCVISTCFLCVPFYLISLSWSGIIDRDDIGFIKQK